MNGIMQQSVEQVLGRRHSLVQRTASLLLRVSCLRVVLALSW